MNNKISRRDYIRELRKWIREMPGWWFFFFVCVGTALTAFVVAIALTVKGDFSTAMQAWAINFVSLAVGCIPLSRIFGSYFSWK